MDGRGKFARKAHNGQMASRKKKHKGAKKTKGGGSSGESSGVGTEGESRFKLIPPNNTNKIVFGA